MEQLAKKGAGMRMKKAQSGSDGYKPEAVPDILKMIHSRIQSNNELEVMIEKTRTVGGEKMVISHKVGAVFIPVNNMPRAVRWYRDILELSEDPNYQNQERENERTVYNIQLDNITLLLDSMQRDKLSASQNHLFYFETNNLREAHTYLKNKGVEIMASVEEIFNTPGNHHFGFKDSEGNILFAFQA